MAKLLAVTGAPPPAAIEVRRDRVVGSWADGRVVHLVHKDSLAAGPFLAKTALLRLEAPAPWPDPELGALVAQISKYEAELRWVDPAAGPRTGTGGGQSDGPGSQKDDAALQDILGAATRSLRIEEKQKVLKALRDGAALVAAKPRTRALLRARLGALLLQAGEPQGQQMRDAAIAELAVSAAADPTGTGAAEHIAAVALADPATAVSQAKAAVEKGDAGIACAWVDVARSLDIAGDAVGARAIADTIRVRAPTCLQAWLLAGELTQTGPSSWQQTVQLADAALKHHPESLHLLFLKASALHSGWQNREAAEVWETVARKDLHYPSILGMLATAYTQLPEATEDGFLAKFKARLAAHPEDVVARYIIGTILYYRDDFNGVIEMMDPLRAVVPREPRVHLYTAMSHFNLGHIAEADERLATLDKMGHDDPDYYYCRSVMNRRRDFSQSLIDLETFARLSQKRQNTEAKETKVNRELEVMRTGRLPNAFDMLPAPLRYGALGIGGGLLVGLPGGCFAAQGPTVPQHDGA